MFVDRRNSIIILTVAVAVVLSGTSVLAATPDKASARADDKHPSPVLKKSGVQTGIVAGGLITQLFARASDSLVAAAAQSVLKGLPYISGTPPLGTGVNTTGVQTVTGPSFIPSAEAVITSTTLAGGGASWTTAGTVATIAANPAPPPPPPPAEKAHAVAKSTDPITMTGIGGADQATFTLEIGTNASLLINPSHGLNETEAASYTGFDTTTLNGIGTLWTWAWSADSLHPGTSIFSFVSNPLLGLDDTLLQSSFMGLVSYDPSTGAYGLTAPFDVSTTFGILPGQSSLTYGGEADVNADASIPEPMSAALLAFGLVGLGLSRKCT